MTMIGHLHWANALGRHDIHHAVYALALSTQHNDDQAAGTPYTLPVGQQLSEHIYFEASTAHANYYWKKKDKNTTPLV
jgi:hypothetical protein